MKLSSRLPSRSFRRFLAGALLAFPLVCLTLLMPLSTAHALAINAPAPAFTLPQLEGGKIALDSFRGEIVVLKIGTTWCPGCREQSHELQELDAFLGEKKIRLIEVFIDEDATTVKEYQKEYPLKTPAVTLFADDGFTRAYGVYAIPRLLILNPQLKVVTDSTGMTARQIKARILQIMEKK